MTRSYARLAALALDACDDESDVAVVVARRTVQRLDLGARVEQSVAALINDIELLPAAARRSDALAEESVLQIAVHLDSVEQADALHAARARGCRLRPRHGRAAEVAP